MHSGVEGNKSELVKISLNEFKKLQQDEIWLNDDLYDIRSSQIKGNIVELTVVHDSKEESIISRITDHFKSENDYVSNDNYKHICKKHSHASDQFKCLHNLPPIQISSQLSDGVAQIPIFYYIPYELFSVLSPPPKVLIV